MDTQSEKTRLLLIDDDRDLGRLMTQFLSDTDFEIETSVDGLAGLKKSQEQSFDLILLDVGLPGLDGFSVLRKLRETQETPVIMLTSRSTTPDRLAGLDGGADDYLAKPFDPDELIARVRAVMRRYALGKRRVGEAKEFGPIRIIEAERTVFVNDKQIDLTEMEFDVLLMLSKSAGKLVTREALTINILGRQPSFFERSLDVHVSRIRAKLGSEGKLIRTTRGEGYTFLAEGVNRVAIS